MFLRGFYYWGKRAPEDLLKKIAPVAQLDRASDYGSEGSGFESLRAYKNNNLDGAVDMNFGRSIYLLLNLL